MGHATLDTTNPKKLQISTRIDTIGTKLRLFKYRFSMLTSDVFPNTDHLFSCSEVEWRREKNLTTQMLLLIMSLEVEVTLFSQIEIELFTSGYIHAMASYCWWIS